MRIWAILKKLLALLAVVGAVLVLVVYTSYEISKLLPTYGWLASILTCAGELAVVVKTGLYDYIKSLFKSVFGRLSQHTDRVVEEVEHEIDPTSGCEGEISYDSNGEAEPIAYPPPLPRNVYDSDDYARDITREFDHGSNCVFLYGPGGMGKTTVAADYAHNFARRRFGVVLYIDCNGSLTNAITGLSFKGRVDTHNYEANLKLLSAYLNELDRGDSKALIIVDGFDAFTPQQNHIALDQLIRKERLYDLLRNNRSVCLLVVVQDPDLTMANVKMRGISLEALRSMMSNVQGNNSDRASIGRLHRITNKNAMACTLVACYLNEHPQARLAQLLDRIEGGPNGSSQLPSAPASASSEREHAIKIIGRIFDSTVTDPRLRHTMALARCFMVSEMDESLFRAGLRNAGLEDCLEVLLRLKWIQVGEYDTGYLRNGEPSNRTLLSLHRSVYFGCASYVSFRLGPKDSGSSLWDNNEYRELAASFLDGVWSCWLAEQPLAQAGDARSVVDALDGVRHYGGQDAGERQTWEWIVVNRACMALRLGFDYGRECRLREDQLKMMGFMPQRITERPHALGLAADHKPLRGSDPVRVPKNIAFCDVLTQQGFAQRKAARETDLDSEISATRESIKSLTQAATKGGWDFKTQTFDANQWSAADIDHAKDRTAFALATLCYVEGRLAGGSSRPGLRGKKLEEAQRHGKNAISLVKGTHTATEAITLHFFALTLVCLLESMMLDSSPEREKTIVRVAKKVIKHEDNAAEILQDGDYGLRGKRTLADCWAGSSKAYETLATCSSGAAKERYLKHAVVSLKNSVELTGACYGPQHPDTLQRKVRLEKLQADLG